METGPFKLVLRAKISVEDIEHKLMYMFPRCANANLSNHVNLQDLHIYS